MDYRSFLASIFPIFAQQLDNTTIDKSLLFYIYHPLK